MSNQDVDVFLEHFGVKGMKWGIRRQAKKEAIKDVGKLKKINRKGGTGSRARAEAQKNLIKDKASTNSDYKRYSTWEKNRTKKEIRARKIDKVVTTGLAVTFIASDPRTRAGARFAGKHMKTGLMKMASVSGKVYRRMGESEAERIIRNMAYVPRDGSTVVPAYSRVVGEVIKIRGALDS